ncbi:MAG: hypothetical protein Q9169_006043 [Polycauliona sp. 2 TL-2023]
MAPPASLKRSCSSFESRNSGSPNRVHRLIITRDPGKPIYKASSPVALITGLIGAIKGHESSLNAGILHRDVSISNIMLTENEDDGFLIDYDLAIKTTSDRVSGASGKTGTKVFMAIGALLGEPHSFMHDLESIFWVLFWICIHWDGRDKKRRESDFEDWNYLSTKKLAREKTGQISKGIFNTVDDYFTDHCKPLIPCLKELHKVFDLELSSVNLHLHSLISLLETDSQSRLKYLAELELEGTLSSKPRQSNLAGTKIFMAIGALLSEPHSFMHDLESFFWVFFWICIHYAGLNGKGEVKCKIVPEYEKWNYAGTKELANLKRGLVVEEADFNKTITDFTLGCILLIPCIQELRKCIFPNGKRWPGENKELYSQTKAVLDKAREDPGL